MPYPKPTIAWTKDEHDGLRRLLIDHWPKAVLSDEDWREYVRGLGMLPASDVADSIEIFYDEKTRPQWCQIGTRPEPGQVLFLTKGRPRWKLPVNPGTGGKRESGSSPRLLSHSESEAEG